MDTNIEANENILPHGFSVFIEIKRAFDFLRKEGYDIGDFFIGREIYVEYHNHKINQTISVVLPEPNENTGWKWKITIKKQFFIFSKMISVTDNLELVQFLSVMDQLMAYSNFMRENMMSIIRGEDWTNIGKCQYNKSIEDVARCVDLDDLSEQELLFWKIYSSFSFLKTEWYNSKQISLCGRHPFILYRNDRINQDVYIEWYSLFDVNVKITKYGFFHERSFEIRNVKKYFNDNLSSLKEIRRSALGCQNEIEVSSNIIQQHLMPVIRGEMWIDELLP